MVVARDVVDFRQTNRVRFWEMAEALSVKVRSLIRSSREADNLVGIGLPVLKSADCTLKTGLVKAKAPEKQLSTLRLTHWLTARQGAAFAFVVPASLDTTGKSRA